MRIRNEMDFWSGVMFAGIGIAAMVIARGYGLGTLRAMGPGFFPTAVGAIMTFLGVIMALKALTPFTARSRIDRVGWRELGLLLLALGLFAFFLPRLGLVVSVALLVLTSLLANRGFRLVESVITTIGLVVLSWAIFALGLGVQVPVWPVWLGG